MYKCSKCQIDKARVLPSGAHGDVISVGERGVTDIILDDGGFILVCFIKNGKPERFVIRDWVHCTVTEDEYKCEKCGQSFANPQGLGKHATTCTGKK